MYGELYTKSRLSKRENTDTEEPLLACIIIKLIKVSKYKKLLCPRNSGWISPFASKSACGKRASKKSASLL